ncbi:MAG: hypothetical protein ACTSR8_22400 [Promethearchaeota archaeon]
MSCGKCGHRAIPHDLKELPENTRLLSICCTRGKPELVQEMLKSFDETKSEGTEIVLFVWKDDPKVEQYKKALEGRNVLWGDKLFMGDVLNYISTEVYPDVDYYQNINDDHYYVVKGWDKMMTGVLDDNKGWGVSYCKGKDNAHNPNAEIVSGKIVRAIGWYVYPGYRQFGLEPYFISLGEACGFFLIPEVIEHRSINAGFGAKDDIYAFIYSPEEAINARKAYDEWQEHKAGCFEKIRLAIRKEMQEAVGKKTPYMLK